MKKSHNSPKTKKETHYHHLAISDVLDILGTDASIGLSEEQALNRVDYFGTNTIIDEKPRSLLVRFFAELNDAMVFILLTAAGVSLAVNLYEGEGLFEPFLIISIVITNAFIALLQEGRAERALESLKDLSSPEASVIRNNETKRVASKHLVPGDIIKIEAGNLVPADCRIISSTRLLIDESMLTGESLPVNKSEDIVPKNVSISERQNMIYSGCPVTQGHALAIVTHTGMNTEVGKIARMLSGKHQSEIKTPLQKRLTELSKRLGFIAILTSAIVLILGMINGLPFLDLFMVSISLAVSSVPEGLAVTVSVILAVGVQRMVKRNAIIRKLPAVETLGSASVICSDKTGTLTQNHMSVTELYTFGGGSEKINSNISIPAQEMLIYASLCSNIEQEGVNNRKRYNHIGSDPTEFAILSAADKFTNSPTYATLANSRYDELPFDSDRKIMTTAFTVNDGTLLITKGAPDKLMKISINSQQEINELQNTLDKMSESALRVIAVGVRELNNHPPELKSKLHEKNIRIIGIMGIIDPPRKEAKEAVKLCIQAGIKPIMITGDHIQTAIAIAKQLNILSSSDTAVTGDELANMSESDLLNKIHHISVFARVTPSDKIRIVKAWQKNGAIVAMTGDGVNDAPALKQADVGCAMGIAGSDVANSAADITLSDDNFSTIVAAIQEGRGIYSNILKVIKYLLSTNISEMLSVLIAMLLWKQPILLANHLLWINLVTDSLPAIALGLNPVDKNIMKQKPRPKNESIFANGLWKNVTIMGMMFSAATLTSFWLGMVSHNETTYAQTMAFITLASSQILYSLSVHSSKTLYSSLFTNKYLLGAVTISFITTIFVVLIPPVQNAFGFIQLTPMEYATSFGLAAIPTLIIELKNILQIKN